MEKRRLIAATLEPGASVAAVARAHGLNTNMLFNWRRQARRAEADAAPASEAAEFVPIGMIGSAVAPPAASRAAEGPTGRIEIELPNGIRLRLDASVAAPALRRVVATLKDIG